MPVETPTLSLYRRTLYTIWKSANPSRLHQPLTPQPTSLLAAFTTQRADQLNPAAASPLTFNRTTIRSADGINLILDLTVCTPSRSAATGGGVRHSHGFWLQSCRANAGALGKGKMLFMLPVQTLQLDWRLAWQAGPEVVVAYAWYGRLLTRCWFWSDFQAWVTGVWGVDRWACWEVGGEDDDGPVGEEEAKGIVGRWDADGDVRTQEPALQDDEALLKLATDRTMAGYYARLLMSAKGSAERLVEIRRAPLDEEMLRAALEEAVGTLPTTDLERVVIGTKAYLFVRVALESGGRE